MKQSILFCFAILLSTWATAQVESNTLTPQQMREQYAQQRHKAKQQYSEAQQKAMADYAAFRKKANEEYAEAVKKAWAEMGVQPAIPKPKEPEPPRPTPPPPDRIPTTIPLPQLPVERCHPPQDVPLPPPINASLLISNTACRKTE